MDGVSIKHENHSDKIISKLHSHFNWSTTQKP